MADDVIVRDDLIEFKNTQRCETCQTRDRDCIMRMGAAACLLCADTERPCIFDRIVRLRGSATRLPRDVLLAKQHDLDLNRHSFTIPQ